MSTQTGYGQDIELKMKRLFATLSEKDRRRYAAIEAAKATASRTTRRTVPGTTRSSTVCLSL
ncbi:MAG: hypothetical protein ABJA84_08750 [Polaromonas sp.]